MPGAAPQQQGGGGGGGQEDGSTAILWAVAAVFVLLGIIWYKFKIQIITAYLHLKLWEVDFLSNFTSRLGDVKNLILMANPHTISFQDLQSIGQIVGTYLRIPFTAILIVLALVVYFTNVTRSLRNIYSMKKLAQVEKVNWPQIIPVANLDLIHTDIDKGPWAMAMTPIQFCKKYKLIEEYRRPRQEGVSRKEAERIEVVLKRGEANKIFALQLGPVWEGLNKVPPYVKALFAVFAARINADTKIATDMITQLNRSSTTNLNYVGIGALCSKYEDTKIVKKITQSHAYVLTVMASMLEAARADGVQATADFLWLKPLDRRLWYMLNTIGRQTPFVESAGPYAHWLAEKEAGRKLVIPIVEGATNALDLVLKDTIYRPEEQT